MSDRYRELIAALPTPTVEQTGAFAAFVAAEHSWYKHLSAAPPGTPFAFFLDPWVGIKKYAKHLTAGEYLARFGHWSFAIDRGEGRIEARIEAPNGAFVPVSPGLLAVGTVNLTAHVHENFIAVMVRRLALLHQKVAGGAVESTGPREEKYYDPRGLVALWERYEDDLEGLDRELAAERGRVRDELKATLLCARAWLDGR